MVSIRSDDIRGRWGRLIDNTASFTSIDLSGQASSLLSIISGQVIVSSGVVASISGQISGFSINPTTIDAGSATFSSVIVQSGVVAGSVTISGVALLNGVITIEAAASGFTYSGMQMLPCIGSSRFVIWESGGTVKSIDTQTGLIAVSGTNLGQVFSGTKGLLTSGRTWKESITIIGKHDMTSGWPIVVDSYTKLEVNGKISISGGQTGLPTIITNRSYTGVSGSQDTQIEVVGGEWTVISGTNTAVIPMQFKTCSHLTLRNMHVHGMINAGLATFGVRGLLM